MKCTICTINADMANKILLKKFIWLFLNAMSALKMPHQHFN